MYGKPRVRKGRVALFAGCIAVMGRCSSQRERARPWVSG